MSYSSNYKDNVELTKLQSNALIELYELDTSTVIQDPYFSFDAIIYRWHPYNITPDDSNADNDEDKNKGVIVYQGNKYFPLPLSVSNYERKGDGTLPLPSVKISNIYPTIKDLTLNLGDLVGATFIRRRVYKKFLDNKPDADVSANFEDESYLINRKKTETKLFIEFELITQIEANNLQLPRRVVTRDFCSFYYRQDGCNFRRAKIIDLNNVFYGTADNVEGNQNLPDPTQWDTDINYNVNDVVYITTRSIKYYYLCKVAHTSSYANRASTDYWIADDCAKTCDACKLRWVDNVSEMTILPFGGFASTSQQIT